MSRQLRLLLLLLGLALADVGAVVSSDAANIADTSRRSWPKCGPVCDIYCEFGNVLDARGCPTCKCKPPPICPLSCEIIKCPTERLVTFTDANGCRRCTCKPPICPLSCELIKCPAEQLVTFTDANGCRRCRCDPIIKCPKVNCTHSCPSGYLTDDNGCPTCNCDCVIPDCARCPPPQRTELYYDNVTGCPIGCRCEPPICPLSCELIKCPAEQLVTFTDENGCRHCRCDPIIKCPKINCTHSCPSGYLTDANGCSTCKCGCVIPDCAQCPPPQRTELYYDNVTGCPIGCRCEPPICPLSCELIKCPAEQLVTFTDDNGCRHCRCDPIIKCPKVNCTHSCPSGYLTDDDGCPTCNCDCVIPDCAQCPPPQRTVLDYNPVTACPIGCHCVGGEEIEVK